MNTWTILDTSERTIELAGKQFTVQVEIAVTEDDVDPDGDFDFDDAEENAAYLARFRLDTGDLYMGLIRVTASWEGLEGIDFLGACHLKAGDAEDALSTAADHGMVETALAELRTAMVDMQTKLGGEDAP